MKTYDKVAISTKLGKVILKLADIIYFERMGNNTMVYTRAEERHTANKSIEFFENMLSRYNFMRNRNAYLINMDYLRVSSQNNGSSTRNISRDMMKMPKKIQSVLWAML